MTHRQLGIGLTLLLVVPAARGDLYFEAVGDPASGGSWYQDFRLVSSDLGPDSDFSGLGMALTLTEEPTGAVRPYQGFEGSAMDFSDPWATEGWHEEPLSLTGRFSHIALAAGDPTSELLWQSHFRDDPETQAFTITLYTYDLISDLFPAGSATASWSGSDWEFNVPAGVTWAEFQAAAMTPSTAPVPGAVWLAAMGLLIAGAIRRFA